MVEDKITGEKKEQVVPCGKCIGCLSRRRSTWSYRLWYEKLYSESCFFITLTYDNEHLPLDNRPELEEVQKYLKRLRKKGKFRYFLVSENGDKFGRIHYHQLLFFKENVELFDCIRRVSDAWQKGNIQVGEVTLASIQYVTKYCLKNHLEEYDLALDQDTGEVYYDKVKHLVLMSRRPGIGSDVLGDTSWIRSHLSDSDGQFEDNINGHTFLLPRYYRDKIFDDLQKFQYQEKIRSIYGKKRTKPGFRTSFDQRADKEFAAHYHSLKIKSCKR